MAEGAKWYVLHTYSSYENAVKSSILKFVNGRKMEDMVLRIEIPMENVTEVTESGVVKDVERKIFPGYVLIQMVLTDETWHLVRNVRGVTGFVGTANKPIPLTEDEVYAMGMDEETLRKRDLAELDPTAVLEDQNEKPAKKEISLTYAMGDQVTILSGPFASYDGVVEEVDSEHNRVVVVVSIFGRETPVELELGQVGPKKD
ncbi:transcription termination/antitermination protein NusG [Bengtsoniella intestinalis]|uniref:transcription termination/antitermination protein NusG n=1 Tax=Bengtsoniella intestinalis TaxID=3073143 RepID=UPI00391FAE82